jgi:uncharacterized protein (DUF433 family)
MDERFAAHLMERADGVVITKSGMKVHRLVRWMLDGGTAELLFEQFPSLTIEEFWAALDYTLLNADEITQRLHKMLADEATLPVQLAAAFPQPSRAALMEKVRL